MKITVEQEQDMNIMFRLSEGKHEVFCCVDRSMLTNTKQPAAHLLLAVGKELGRACDLLEAKVGGA